MAVATNGAIGPDITADAFRAQQPDQVEGIDLHDARIAAAHFGVPFDVHADYGGTSSMPWAEFVTEGVDKVMVIQGIHGALRPILRCDGFMGPHAVAVDGFDAAGWRVSNPLCNDWVTWSGADMHAFTSAMSKDRVNVAIVGRTDPMLYYGRELADVAKGVPFYDSPGGIRIGAFSRAATIESIGYPSDASADHKNFAWRACIVQTGAVDGVQAKKVVYVARSALTNIRPVPPQDTSGARAAGYAAAKEDATALAQKHLTDVEGMTDG